MSACFSVRGAAGLKALSVLLAVLAAGCNSSAARPIGKKTPEVIVTTPIGDEVTDYQDFTGRLDGFKTVEIRARVSGFVLSAPFTEGDVVGEGDLLLQIDPQPYQADLNLAEANVKLAQADQKLQEKTTTRARELIRTKAIAPEDFDTAIAALEKSQAMVASVSAARDRAKLYLDYTRVKAPLSGRISRRFVDPGNLVTADVTTLTTIVSDSKLYAYFDVDERTFLDQKMSPASPGASTSVGDLHLPVLVRLANEEQFAHSGIVDFIDNRVNATTGTIRLRAIFENSTGSLRAGLFVRIRLPIGTAYQALLIPDEAVLSDQGRKYVYVVDGKNEVVYHTVTLGQEIQGLRVIKKGLSKGERVIVGGMQRVRAGSQVQPKMQEPPKPPVSPLKQLGVDRPAPAVADKPAKPADNKGQAPGQEEPRR